MTDMTDEELEGARWSIDINKSRAMVDEIRRLRGQRATLLRALNATLESHDIGHSPCDCVEVRPIVASFAKVSP